MKKISVRFERDPSLTQIDVVIRASEQDAAVTELMEKLAGHPPNRQAVFDEYGNVRLIAEDEIIIASVNGKLINLVTADGSWYIRQTLQSLEAKLDSHRFIRISRYELINLNQVIRYDFTAAGMLRIELKGGIDTWASRRCIPAIRRVLKGKG